MNQIVVEDQVSVTIGDDQIPCATSGSNEIDSDGLEFVVKNGLAKIQESSLEDFIIRTSFFSGMGQNSGLAKKTKIVAIHKNLNSSWSGKARAQSFQVFSKAVADKCGGDANVKYAWYGAASDEISDIVMHGFSWCLKADGNRDCSRHSISLSPAKFSFDSVLSSEVDENGLGLLLLCRVILGKQEVVTADSNQFHPSSPEFDSSVDDLSAPRKYIVWSPYMNSHILPCYIISFEAPYLRGSKGLVEANTIKPRSPWMRFPTLISMLSRFLGPSEMASLNKQYRDFREKRISRPQLIQRVKEIAGNQLLAAVVSLYSNKCAGVSSSKRRLMQLVR
ncbi:probable inactive poly [ADP-ribose] polymerase SRO2 isoform X4 [Durio zibethinus]|uniref:Probable inactive poly [ADP-ribose] polymerase SRO2 isoform X4 n=1 Tax=Durio zibethinus TaxID=66656 RepID=A0A6P5XY76_DURZI|nr:probable inactive poly [ADP-ribose] polymerase SRO2 isoform X4 [Durio zibethinus]